MRGYCKVHLLGRVSEPEVKETRGGTTYARFGLVTEKSLGKGKGTEPVWHNITAWGQKAEVVEKYLKKGDIVFVECRLDYSETDDGSKYVNLTVDNMVFAGGGEKQDDDGGSRRSSGGRSRRDSSDEDERPSRKKKPDPSPFDPDDDDLPF